MRNYIDLHVHSTASDGTYSPTEIAEKAFKEADGNDVVLALTDHDTTAGTHEIADCAQRLNLKAAAAGEDRRFTFIPGIEISTNYAVPGSEPKRFVEIHILGYGLNPDDSDLNEKLLLCRKSRDIRNVKVINALREKHGFDITMDMIQAREPGASIARPHIARALMNLGYVTSVSEAFEKYIGDDCDCYFERQLPTPEEAIEMIHHAGGIASLAHIIHYKKLNTEEKEVLVASLSAHGLDCIETYHNINTAEDTLYVKSLAAKYHLLETGGTDFHGANKPHISLFTGQEDLPMRVPEKILPPLLTHVKNILVPKAQEPTQLKENA